MSFSLHVENSIYQFGIQTSNPFKTQSQLPHLPQILAISSELLHQVKFLE